MAFSTGIFNFGGGSTNNSATRTPTLPSNVQPGFNTGIAQWEAAQNTIPSLTAQYYGMPQLDVPNLTPEQLALIQQVQSQGAASPQLAAAAQQLQELTAGPIGSSPATQAAMKAYQQQVIPQLLQQGALSGTASGGATQEAIAQGTQSALVPLLEKEIATRQAAVSQYGNLNAQSLQGMAAALEAAGMPREVAAQQAMALYERQAQQQRFAQGLQSVPINLIPSLIGNKSTNTVSGTGGTGDLLSGGLGAIGSILGGGGGGMGGLSSILGMFGGGGTPGVGSAGVGGGNTGTSIGDPSGVGGMAGESSLF